MTAAATGRRTALITGASAGIGTELARVFARAGWDLVLTARRADRLEALAAEMIRDHGIEAECIPADLADPAAPQSLFDQTEGRGRAIDALVNNAGYGVPGAFAETGWEDYRALLQVLGTAPIELTHLYTTPMRERGYGRILQIARWPA